MNLSFLAPFSLIYRAGLSLHRSSVRQRKLSRPVISVGNITWGGTGKTPLVIRLAGDLMKCGLKVAVLTRGYFRKNRAKNIIVLPGNSGPAMAGDEPCLISKSLPAAKVYVSPDRYASAKQAETDFAPDIFVLDDGFQHWKVARDTDVVCINATNPFGNGLLIPAGMLREPLSSLRRANIVVITHSNEVSPEKMDVLKDRIKEYCDAPVISAKYEVASITGIFDGTVVPAASLNEAVAVSGLGDNSSFISIIERSGVKIAGRYHFRDHFNYTESGLHSILAKHPGKAVLTTSKDAVKIIEILKNNVPNNIFEVKVELVFVNGEEHWKDMIEKAPRFS
jgi:tetraacyldisaccharide 4'-kinase